MHLLAPAPFGGLERVVETLAAEQARAGHEVHAALILDPGPPDHPLVDALRHAGVTSHIIQVPARGYREEQRVVARLLRDHGPHILHTHGYRPAVLHGGAARRSQVAAVATAHGYTAGDIKNRVYEWLMTRAFRSYDAVVAVSRPMVSRLTDAGVARDRISVIPNAWSGGTPAAAREEARSALGIPAGKKCVGFAGRLSHEKGVDVLMTALQRTDPGLSAVIVGDGPLRRTLELDASAQGLSDRVHWCGTVPGAGRLMKAFDMFVISSRTEGTPMVLLEAMAAGVPVVATSVGGIPDVMTNEEGWIVPAEDAGALADAMNAVLSDPAESSRRAMRAAARVREEFGAAQWVERYDDAYRVAIARVETRKRAGAR
ncbi:MAG TPA: glycosyltransferase family 4 protein [Longimicrobiales bacterium]